METQQDSMKWKTLKSEYLFRRPWLTVRRETVQLPDGRINPEFYILDYPTWINVIAITKDGKMVMERQYRHGLGETCYEICAGVSEEGEKPEEAARRELEEETGYTGGKWELLCVISGNTSVTSNLTYCFLAKDVEKTSGQKLDDTEDLEIHLMEPRDVFDLMVSDKIKQALMLTPLWKYFYFQLLNVQPPAL